MPVKRRGSREQLIENDTERVDIAARVDIELIEFGLFGAHVLERSHDLAVLREHRFFE